MSDQGKPEYRMNPNGIDFVFYTVSDFAASLSFYRDTLRLELESMDEDIGWAEFAAPPTTLVVDEADPQMPVTSGGGGTGVALAVDDVEASIEELRNGGVTVLMDPLDTGVCHMAIIADPDDNHIMLHRRHDGTHGRVDSFP